MTRYRTAFIPRNNLDSKKIPIFRPQTPPSPDDHEDSYLPTTPYSAIEQSQHPALQQRPSSRLASTTEAGGKTLSELGDSSSLFSHQSPPDDRSACASSPYLGNRSPILLEQGKSNRRRQLQKTGPQVNNMVNERSPAKAPLYPVMANEQPRPPREPESSLLSKPLQATTSQFGLPSMPQSSLNPPKESNVFFQPKSRPEHHRDVNKPSTVPIYPVRYEFYF